MALFRTIEPAVEPVGVADVKAQLRIVNESEDDFLSGLIRAARHEVEARAGLALIDQSWRLTLNRWPWAGRARIGRHPVKQILSVTVYGADGEGSLVDPATYQVDTDTRPARVQFDSRPEPFRCMNGIEIDFSAGFGPAVTDVPDDLRRAILVLVAHWYEFRAAFGADDQPVSIPDEFDRLIAGHRIIRL